MSQLVACKTPEGIVFGADSKAVDVDANGNLIELKVERLHQLSEYAAILNGGPGAGEYMCNALKNFLAEENLLYIDEIYQASLPFLSTEYERFMRRACQVQPIDPVHQVTFLLGGYSQNNTSEPFQLYLLWTKRRLPLLDSDPIGTAFTVPRVIKLEHQLHKMANTGGAIEKVMSQVRSSLEALAEKDEETSEPLSFAYITSKGLMHF
jgi:20S proteasome alpha/beta subunit